MAYAANKQSHDDAAKKKRSPLAGLFGRSGEKQAQDEALPEMDIEGGLGRALRLASNAPVPHREDLSSHNDNVRDALASIEGALFTIDRVRDFIEQAYEVALSAQDVEDVGGRALLAESYDELRLSINAAIDAAEDRAAAPGPGGQHAAGRVDVGAPRVAPHEGQPVLRRMGALPRGRLRLCG